MAGKTTPDPEITAAIAGLTPEEQQKVLRYARSLRENIGRGTPGRELLRFAGTLSEEDAEAFLSVLRETRRICIDA